MSEQGKGTKVGTHKKGKSKGAWTPEQHLQYDKERNHMANATVQGMKAKKVTFNVPGDSSAPRNMNARGGM